MSKPKVLQEIAKVESIPSGQSVQQELVSGTNIKTINTSSILGSGDLNIDVGKIDHIQVEGVEQTITDKTVNITKQALGLSQALKFIGISTTEITDQGTEDPTIGGTVITTKNNGDVVIYNNFEFVWANSCWNKLGDDSSWQTKINLTSGKLLKQGASSGVIAEATAGTDYQTPLTAGTDYQTPITATGVLKGAGSGSVSAANAADIPGVTYLTSAPTSANTDGLKFVVLDEEPATKYDGYMYIITA